MLKRRKRSILAGSALLALAAFAPAVMAERIGDAERGAEIYRKCAACHMVGAQAKNRIGPHLNGIFGRKAAALDGFRYSDAMRRAGADGLIWELDKLDAYLENPKALVTGTRMSFAGIRSLDDRHDVLAYLRTFSDKPRDIPEASPTAVAHEVALAPEVLAMAGDRDYGEYLSSECLTCHRKDGSDRGIPAITGWRNEDFVVAMHAYRQKLRPHPVMQMMAGRLSDEEIAALAAYFAALE